MTNNKYVNEWVAEMAELTQPDKIVWITGDDEQTDALRAEACSTGEIEKLNEEKLPNCYLHRTAVNDVARVEGRTFICTKERTTQAPQTTGWVSKKQRKSSLPSTRVP